MLILALLLQVQVQMQIMLQGRVRVRVRVRIRIPGTGNCSLAFGLFYLISLLKKGVRVGACGVFLSESQRQGQSGSSSQEQQIEICFQIGGMITVLLLITVIRRIMLQPPLARMLETLC